MNTLEQKSLLALFYTYQQKILKLCAKHAKYFNIQYHPTLSPLGWHLGHCVHTEIFWIREQLLYLPPSEQKLQALYTPELAKKYDRGETLPDYPSLNQWAHTTQHENLYMMKKYQNIPAHPLMQNNFLLHFLIQHYAQHIETMQMILVQKALQESVNFVVRQTLTNSKVNTATVGLQFGNYTVGAEAELLPYDNEYPAHIFSTDTVNIVENPVSNGEFLSFMIDAGYQTAQYWSQKGWQWKEKNALSHPEFWQRDDRDNWFGIDIEGPHDLIAEKPVWGINYFEAQAFATWAGGHLPHEHEWEVAMQNNCLKGVGQTWEWCQNSFYPYSNLNQGNKKFRAFPYKNYSEPYFDGLHFVLRGGSRHTQAVIRRNSFRNYYQADKRHQFAGCRMVFR